MSLTKLAPGTLFAGDYRIVSPLAEGGMGAVYVAEQLSTGTRRAVKVMQPELAANPRSRERFDQEARLGALIPSEHVVKVVQAGLDDETAMPWLCMELLDGEDLSQVLSRRGALTRAELRLLFEQACHALELAHRVPIVHRDLKPENLFLSRPLGPGVPFSVKILDFGIAKLVSESPGLSAKTASIGTPLWMAPEQADAGASVTPAADVWALGLIAFRALTGRLYWRAANVENASVTQVFAEVLTGALPPASERARELGVPDALPTGFDGWFSRCVTRAQGDRFAHAGEARDALLALLATAPASGELSLSATVPLSAVTPRDLAEATPAVGAVSAARSLPAAPEGVSSVEPTRRPIALAVAALVLVVTAVGVASLRRPEPSSASASASAAAASSRVAALEEAARLRRRAAADSLGPAAHGCLADLQQAELLDAAGAAEVPGDVLARCEMGAGRCDAGRKRYRDHLKTDPRVPSISIDAMVRTVTARTCPEDQLDQTEKVVLVQSALVDAWSTGDADTCLARARQLVAMIPTLPSRDGNDEAALNTALGGVQTASACLAKAGRCAEGRALHRDYYRLAPYFAALKPAVGDATFDANHPACARARGR